MEEIQYYERLIKMINEYDHAYYIMDDPVVSDFEYDKTMRELKNFEEEHPELIRKDSPTQRVSGRATFAPVKHRSKMLSLDNVFDIGNFGGWLAQKGRNTELWVEPKFDGLALSVSYEFGELISAVTRGDGVTGEDVLGNARAIRNIPLRLPENDYGFIEIRGEVIMPNKAFSEVNAERAERGEKVFSNPRNAAAGTLRQKDPAEVLKRNLSFKCYGIYDEDGESLFDSEEEAMRFCTVTLGLDDGGLSKLVKNEREAFDVYSEFIEKRYSLPFDIDGLVFKVNSRAKQIELGETNKFPRWAIAFKLPAMEMDTTLVDVKFYVGRSGVVTPVAEFEPVILAGAKVSFATLHNKDEYNRISPYIGQRILVKRAGDVIPKVVLGYDKDESKKIPFITECPECGHELDFSEKEVKVFCPNTLACPAQIETRILYYVSRECADIKGLGEQTLKDLMYSGYMDDPYYLQPTFAELYHLTKEQITKVTGSEIIGEKIYNAIQKAKVLPLWRFITGLGIKDVGPSTAKKLAEHFNGSLDAIIEADLEDLLVIRDIGESTANAIVTFLNEEASYNIIARALSYGVTFTHESEKVKEIGSCCITGSFDISRDEIKAKLAKAGYKVTSSVSKKTMFLLVGENPGSKVAEADELGVRKISFEQLEAMLEIL